jgi:succinyl-CoA synthetase beta subunit
MVSKLLFLLSCGRRKKTGNLQRVKKHIEVAEVVTELLGYDEDGFVEYLGPV